MTLLSWNNSWNHALRSMTNVSRLGTTSARRKAPGGHHSRARDARRCGRAQPPLARRAQPRGAAPTSADSVCSARSVFRSAQRLALSCGRCSPRGPVCLEPPLPCAKRNKAAMKDLSGCVPVSFNGLVGLPPRTSAPRGCGLDFRTWPAPAQHRRLRPSPLPHHAEPRRQRSVLASGRRSAELLEHAQPRAPQRCHSAPSSTLVGRR
jgi:hypothetical protein